MAREVWEEDGREFRKVSPRKLGENRPEEAGLADSLQGVRRRGSWTRRLKETR